MHVPLVMTLLGPDRPGIVEAVAEAVRECGGNWQESRLARLAGHFAGVVQIDMEAGRVEAFREAVGRLEEQERLQCVVTDSEAPEVSGEELTLEITGQDRVGIVHAISDALAGLGVNVESLETTRESAPMSGEMLFQATLKARMPGGLEVEALEERLAAIGEELMLDVRLED